MIASKPFAYKGALHDLAESGGTLAISELFGIKVTPINDKYNKIEIITYGIKATVQTQFFRRQKVVKQPPKPVQKLLSGLNIDTSIANEDI